MKDNNDATFQGGCLCGAYKFQVRNLEAGWQPRRCNCAICRKKGALWVAPPSQDDFIILKDDGNLKSYTFGPKNWSHEFCETCGVNVKVSTLGSGWPMAVNLRALDEAEKLYSREWNKIGGKAWGIVYEPKSYTGELPPGQEDDTEIVNGSCHCGAVTYAAKVKSVEDVKPQSNGSALLSHGILVLPLKNDIQFRMNETNLREYTTKDGLTKVMFCRTCGVPVQAQSPSENNSVLLNLRTLDVEGLDEKWCMNI